MDTACAVSEKFPSRPQPPRGLTGRYDCGLVRDSAERSSARAPQTGSGFPPRSGESRAAIGPPLCFGNLRVAAPSVRVPGGSGDMLFVQRPSRPGVPLGSRFSDLWTVFFWTFLPCQLILKAPSLGRHGLFVLLNFA